MLIEKIVKRVKKNSNYKLNSSYSTLDLFVILKIRGLQVCRGFFSRFFFKEVKGCLFIGKNVSIKHAYKIKAGRNLIIGNNSSINALSEDGIIFGNNVTIEQNSVLIATGVIADIGKGIKIGDNTGINSNAYLAGQGGIEIGENVIIGPGVKIFSENHIFLDLSIPIKEQGVSRKGVIIKDNCWIGANVTILDGVIIETGCVVAAGSVVTKSISQNTIVAGVPAKTIKYR